MTGQLPSEAGSARGELESARRFFQRGMYRKAAEACERLIRAGPPDVDSLELLGLACLELNQADRGIELLERAVGLDPSRTRAWVRLGQILLQRKRPAD